MIDSSCHYLELMYENLQTFCGVVFIREVLILQETSQIPWQKLTQALTPCIHSLPFHQTFSLLIITYSKTAENIADMFPSFRNFIKVNVEIVFREKYLYTQKKYQKKKIMLNSEIFKNCSTGKETI